ncbi:MAG: VCBS domain-containing protein, partial [Pseudomonadota bacterium]
GESITAVYTVTLSDGEGGTVTQDVTVTITGTNDAAVISGDTTGMVDEAPGGPATATGTLTSNDVDNANNVFQAVAVPTSGDNGFGAFTVDAAGNWSYTLDDANPAVQALNDADMLTDTFTVLSEDGTAQVVTVTITGTNDAAVIAGDTTGTVDEAPGGPATATGTLTSTDVDNADNAFQAVASATASANGFGTFTVDASGNWSYTLDDANATVQGLDDTDTLNDTFTVFSEDGTAQVVAIQITGTNDALTVTGLPDPAAVQEGNTGGVPTNESFLLTDFFTASDPDSADTPTVDETSIVITVNAASDTSNFSSLAIFGTGNSTSIVTDTANFDFLADGEQAVFDVSFDIVSGPDTVNETFTITINGENDAPVATAGSNVNATAGGGAVLIETAFSAFDVDATDTIPTATISISSGFVLGEDVLNFGGAAGIADNYDATTGILTLTGPATVSEFVSAIQSITFQNTGSTPGTTNRTITYVLNDGMDDSLPVTSTVTVDGGGGATTFFASTFTAASFMADDQSDPIGQLLSLPPIVSLVEDNSTPDEETPDLSGLIEDVSLEEVSGFENFEDGEGGANQPLQNSTATTGPVSQIPDTQPGAIETVDANPAQNDDSLQIQAQMNVVG